MTRLPREPLDADERSLAARLPRLHGRDEPDPVMDARILAAAHAALASMPVAKRRRGWIVPLTAAASVSLAVGLAWQLQVQPTPSVSSPHAPVAISGGARDAVPAPLQQDQAAPPPPTDSTASITMPSPSRQAMRPADSQERMNPEAVPAEPAAEARAGAPVFVPSPPPESGMADAMPAIVMTPPTAPPAPSAPATPAAASPQAAMARSATTNAAASASGTVLKSEAKRVRAQNEAELAADAVTAEQFSKASVEEDVPPATMDAPAARDAWLRRISELQQQGRIDDAKASLAEFRRRYPDAMLPPELRKLEP